MPSGFDSLELLSAYADNDLEGPAKARLEVALESSEELRAELQALKEMKRAARETGALQAPPMHLWGTIREAVKPVPRRSPWVWRGLPALAAAAALVFGWWLRPPPDPSLEAELASARNAYVSAIGRLTEASDGAVRSLPPETRAQLIGSLEVVDRAIRDAEQALLTSPEDPITNEVLLGLYEEKVRILSLTIETAGPAGDRS